MPDMTYDYSDMSVPALLSNYVAVLRALRAANATRTWDSPTGGYAESLVCSHFGVEPETNLANPGFDLRVVAPYGRVQVKACIRRPGGRSRQLTLFGHA